MPDLSLMMLGKLEPKHDFRTLRMARYITAVLAPAPALYYLYPKLTHLGMMDNDTLGDCTCAAVGHQVQTWTANNGKQLIIPDATIVALYEKFGYVPGQPDTDQGAAELDVLNYWRKHPVDGQQLMAYATINPKNSKEVMQSVYYFGGSYIGVSLPLTAQNQAVWCVTSLSGDGEPGSWGGHAIPIVGYDSKYLYCITWGAVKKMTWNFFRAYCDEAYALLSPDWAGSAGKTPNGFLLSQLESDLQLITA